MTINKINRDMAWSLSVYIPMLWAHTECYSTVCSKSVAIFIPILWIHELLRL